MAVRKYRRYDARVSLRKNEMKTPKISNKKPVESNDKSKKTLVVANLQQEIKIARLLANNDKKVRDKVLKRLNKWLTIRSQSSFVFTKTDFMSLWKGLFYCMWMSDKMLIQEELAESLSKLVHCLKSKDTIILYTSCALQTLATEWFGIDQYRLDKFSMLVRRILRQTFVVCKNHSWNMEWVTEFSKIFMQLFLHVKTDLGFNLHVTEIYLEELAKVGNGNLQEDVVHELIKPFAEYLITTSDERQMEHIMRHIFRYLIFQSDIGLDYMTKFNAWRDAGFPCAHIDDMQKVEISNIEENTDIKDNEDKQFSEAEPENEIEKPLDPRAGKVDIELPPIPFNAAKIAELLSTYKFHQSSTAKSRRQLLRLFDEFTELSQGKMPLGIKKVRKLNQGKKMDLRKAALRLIKFEKNLVSDNVNKKRKRERNGKAVCDETSIDDLKNGNTLDLETNVIKPKNKLTNTTAKTELQDVDTNVVPFKKRKKSDSTCNVSNTKSDVTVNEKKLQIDTSKKNKATKKKLNKKSKKSIDKNVEHKAKKAVISLGQITKTSDLNQHSSISRISNKKVRLEETNNKPITKKESEMKNKITSQKISLKNKSHPMKEQTNLNNSMAEKKKVIFGLSRNTAQHTSEYIRQVRKSPAIPFDANKKPLNSVLKMNPIQSPLNPFYYKK
ncbi:PREDICTED: ribosomal RNA processing protein 1 homolog [Acromyrmex echinatior]|uniref:ribosomal RNA processing protein 1 homolog n=1 Tax=Acromyrmex echinatior TaxID=103372 RepID=UPI000580DAD7|nr:PREDICTED: ribosomal RNA processing protein 1 homolog [Acromyrmex echinatior]XP_011063383.1 PREDICTED: ribosomal RNA processing protein 1 homolog [Acromyrmex echinatior]